MAVRWFDTERFVVTHEAMTELLVAFVAMLVVLTGISWILTGAFAGGTLGIAIVAGGAVGLFLAAALYRMHWIGLVGGIGYLAVRIFSAAVTSSHVSGQIEVAGLVGVFLLLSGVLILCRDAFFE